MYISYSTCKDSDIRADGWRKRPTLKTSCYKKVFAKFDTFDKTFQIFVHKKNWPFDIFLFTWKNNFPRFHPECGEVQVAIMATRSKKNSCAFLDSNLKIRPKWYKVPITIEMDSS